MQLKIRLRTIKRKWMKYENFISSYTKPYIIFEYKKGFDLIAKSFFIYADYSLILFGKTLP